jgi:hypothetical protein
LKWDRAHHRRYITLFSIYNFFFLFTNSFLTTESLFPDLTCIKMKPISALDVSTVNMKLSVIPILLFLFWTVLLVSYFYLLNNFFFKQIHIFFGSQSTPKFKLNNPLTRIYLCWIKGYNDFFFFIEIIHVVKYIGLWRKLIMIIKIEDSLYRLNIYFIDHTIIGVDCLLTMVWSAKYI